MNRVILQVPAVCALAAAAAVLAAAEPMRVEAVLAPKAQIRLDFEDGGKPKLFDYGHWELARTPALSPA
jgi:hypothetical protein